jgi:uncharacterized protein (TIGR01319 family)
MQVPAIISIDIGSTWTKGVLFRVDAGGLHLLARRETPTTVHDLATGFAVVRDDLERAAAAAGLPPPPIRFSSSAKGGLAVVAVGLVPELTLEAAKMAALSAGAKVVKAFAYKLTAEDLREIAAIKPDIILLAGGTDGGNEEYILHNARALAAAAVPGVIIYAGNRAAAEASRSLLAGTDARFAENLFPEFNQLNPEPARAAIRDVFLRQIIHGKGLDRVVAATGCQPKPTPLAFLELAEAIAGHCPGWEEFCALDMGGATTDVYSSHRDDADEGGGVLRRGLPEPDVKRTVEGDLGMRVSAPAVWEALAGMIRPKLAAAGLSEAVWLAYLDRLAADPGHLPQDAAGQACDLVLANACVAEALRRHCGRDRVLYTIDGDRIVRRGKNLSGVKKVIGTGGYLAHLDSATPMAGVGETAPDRRGETILWPREFEYWIDQDYLLPLLGNLAAEMPEVAAQAAIAALRKTIEN